MMKSMYALAVLGSLAGISLGAETTAPHAKVVHEGIDAPQAEALAHTVAAAWIVYVEEFGFDMPETVVLKVTCGRGQPTRLYTDGQDRLFLSIPSKSKLAKPARSGVFNLYGMCHELGHMAMYRLLKDRDWMTGAAAEGWAHYAGSVVVDRVFAAKGKSLWWDPYDYRQDGTARLKRQLGAKKKSRTVQGARQWLKLEETCGIKVFAKLFAASQRAEVDPTDPLPALRAAAVPTRRDKSKAVEVWWETAGPLFVEKRVRSKVKAVTTRPSALSGKPLMLAFDDGASEGRKSIAGGGHARQFEAPASGEWYLRAVHVYGSRYGRRRPPATKFDVALCDEGLRAIAVWEKPFATFDRGPLRWVRIPVRPTRVPARFRVCLNFRPTASRGVFVGYDTSTQGNSLVGTPGRPGSPFKPGDWMIRVELDRPKGGDALRGE